eukprot:3847163-Amphidinium_carterae.5
MGPDHSDHYRSSRPIIHAHLDWCGLTALPLSITRVCVPSWIHRRLNDGDLIPCSLQRCHAYIPDASYSLTLSSFQLVFYSCCLTSTATPNQDSRVSMVQSHGQSMRRGH